MNVKNDGEEGKVEVFREEVFKVMQRPPLHTSAHGHHQPKKRRKKVDCVNVPELEN